MHCAINMRSSISLFYFRGVQLQQTFSAPEQIRRTFAEAARYQEKFDPPQCAFYS